MDKEEHMQAFRSEMYKQLDELNNRHQAFKRRVCTAVNLLLPGAGFVLHGGAWMKGIVTLLLLVTYNAVFFTWIKPNVDLTLALLYYAPAVFIWLISTIMVGSLDD